MDGLYELKDAVVSNRLREAFGDDVVLFDEQGESTAHRILAEFSLGKTTYAVLQSEELRKEHEVVIFRVEAQDGNELELTTIEDDDEWEMVAEIYDEMTFSASE